MKRAQRIDGKVRIPLGVATVSDSIVPRPNAEIDDALGTPKAWRQAVSDPNTFEALIERWNALRCNHPQDGGCACEARAELCADELVALAPHYVSKSKVWELLDWCKQKSEDGNSSYTEAGLAKVLADKLAALLEQP